jgi:glucokinase
MQVVALDIGGSHASCAVVRNRDLLARYEMRIEPVSFRQALPSLERLILEVTSQARVELQECSGIVFGFPGIVDSRYGTVIATNEKFNDAVDLDLPGWGTAAFGVPLFLENDARLAILGEQYCGAAEGAEDVVLITLGTGIGAAAMLGSKPLRGRYDQAGCLGGHLPVVLDGRKCTCGNIGCAEAEASTWALPSICREWPGFEDSQLASAVQLDFATLFSAADSGDRIANEVLARCNRVWAALAVALVHAYSPEVLLFGGGVMARSEDILPAIRTHVQRHAWSPRGVIQIKAAALGPAASLHGAVPFLEEILV